MKIYHIAWLIVVLCSGYACNSDSKNTDNMDQPVVLSEEDRLTLSQYSTNAQLLIDAGQLDSAVHWYALMAEKYAQTEEWDSMYSAVRGIFMIGFRQNEFNIPFDFAVEYGEQAITQNDTVGAKFLELQAYIQYREGDIEQSLETYKTCSRIWEQYPTSAKLLGNYNMLGILYTMLGDYQQAETLYASTITLNQQMQDTFQLFANYFNLGDAQLAQDKWQLAALNYEKGQKVLPTSDGLYELNLAASLIRGKRFTEALSMAEEALKKYQEFEGRHLVGLANIYQTLGDAHFSLENYNRATIFFQKSLEEAINSYPPYHRDIGKIHISLGDAYFKQALFNLALREYQSATQVFLPAFQASSVAECPSSDSLLSREVWLMEALRNKGLVYLKLYEQDQNLENLTIAAVHFQTAIYFINQIKQYYTENEAKAFLGDYSIPFIEDALATQFQLYQATQKKQHLETAFELAQQVTAFLLRETINEQRAMQVAQIPPDAIDELNTLNDAISNTQSANAETPQNETNDSLIQQLFVLKQQRLALLEKIEQKYPKYYQLKHALSPIPLDKLQASLDENTLVVKYFLNNSQLYIFAFNQETFHAINSTVDSTFYKHINDFRKTLSDLDYLREAPQEAEQLFLQSSHALYQQLIAPVNSVFDDESMKNLTIIPDGLLNYLSFECLLSQATDNWLDREAYLLNDHTISYAYYAGLLLDDTEGERNIKSRFLGFGTEYDDKTLNRIGAMKQDSIANPQIKETFRDKVLSKLVYADDEVKEVASLLSGKSFLNEQATKINFLKHTPQYEVVHVATHSFIDTENDSTAYIVFNQSNKDDDFLLSLAEIYGLQLDAELIALSGCQTGTGALQRSEGVMSLARAFRFAGSNSMIASQWSISDRASSIIMKEFYAQLKKGASKDEALQQAKLRYLHDDELSSPAYRIPAYWGAMILIGDADPLQFTPARSYIRWLLAAGLGVLILLLGWRYNKGNSTS